MTAERVFDWTAHQAESDRRHWEAVLAHKDDPNQVRVHGKVSHIGPEDPTIPHYMRGHGGGWYGIRFFDGREVESTNLWEQGEIPEEYKDELPDNAVFVDREGRELGADGFPIGVDPLERWNESWQHYVEVEESAGELRKKNSRLIRYGRLRV